MTKNEIKTKYKYYKYITKKNIITNFPTKMYIFWINN